MNNSVLKQYDDGAALIQKCCVLYLLVWAISPPLSIGLIWRILGLGAVVAWFAFEFLRGTQFTMDDVKAVLFILGVILVCYVETGTFQFDKVIKLIALYMLSLCFMIQSHYYGRFSELTRLIPLILLMLIFFNYKTFSTLLSDPTIARKIVRNDDEMIPYLQQGVGGYSLIYLQVCILPAIVMYMIKAFRVNKILFAIAALWLVSMVLVLANAGYSLAIFTSAAAVVIMLFYKGRSAIPAIVTMLIIFVIAMFALIYLEGLRNYLLTVFDGTAVAKKINDLVATNENGEAQGSIYDRVKAYSATFQAIFHYPLIGSLWNDSGIGGHSAMMDNFARYGVIGGLFYFTSILSAPIRFKKIYEKSNVVSHVCNAEFCSLIFIGMLDSMTFEFMPIVLILLPILIQCVYDWEEVDKKNENSVDSESHSHSDVGTARAHS